MISSRSLDMARISKGNSTAPPELLKTILQLVTFGVRGDRLSASVNDSGEISS